MSDQKGFGAIEGLLVLVIAGLVGFTGWYVWNSDKKASKDLSTSQSPAEFKHKSKTKPEVIPEGFTKTTIDKLGLTFAYPKTWGNLVQVSESSSPIYSAGFSETKVGGETSAISGTGGYNVILYANSGRQDFSGGGRGGSLWDYAGFTKVGTKYLSRNIYIQNGQTKESTSELMNPEIVEGKNCTVVLHQYEFFMQPVYEMLINLKGDYYGATMVVDGANASAKAQLKQVATTVEVK